MPPPPSLNTYNFIAKLLLTLIIAMITSQRLPAQLGVAATLVATQTYNQTTSTGVSNTGNDYIVYTDPSTSVVEKMNVAVCDGSVPQLMWTYKVTGTTLAVGSLQLVSSYAFDPDVCLLFRNNRFFAVVVYSDPVAGASYVECYAYTVGTNTWSLTTQINQTVLGANMATAINVDSDQKDHFAIVWDVGGTASNTHCYIVAGNWSTTFLEPVICSITNPGVLLPRLTNGGNTLPMPYKMPDIGVFDETNSVADYIVTVIDDDDDVATYGVIRKGDVCNNNMPSSFTTDFYRTDATHVYTWPRVARHRHVGSPLQEGYTVVYSDYDPTGVTYDINGHTNFYDATIPGFVNTDNVYTDGSAEFGPTPSGNYLPQINSKTLTKPVVSYERQSGSTSPITSQHFVVAFNAIDGNNDVYPLAFYTYNYDGIPYTTVSIYDFNQVPILSSNPNDEQIISVAGEQSHVFLYSWYDANNNGGSMCYKLVTSGAKFRTGIFDNNENEINCLYFSKETNSWWLPESINEASNILIYNLNGQTVCRQSNFDSDVFINALRELSGGMYVTSFSINGKTQNLKLIIQ